MNQNEHNVSILLHLLYYAPELEDRWAGSQLATSFDRRLKQAIRLCELEPRAEHELERQVDDLLEELMESDRSQRLVAILEQARAGGRILPPRVSWRAWSSETGLSSEDRLARLNELRVKGAWEGPRDPSRGPRTRGDNRRETGEIQIPRWPLDVSLNRTPTAELPESSERSINIWLPEDEDAEGSALSPCQTSILHFKVGEAVESSLVAGQDVEVTDSDVPDEGLETRWFLCSSTLDFAAEPGDLAITVSVGASNVHQARFTLRIPKQGESEIRRLRIAARPGLEVASLDVTIFVGTEVYRQVTVRLNIWHGATLVAQDETLHTPLRHADLRTLHEWTTPSGILAITVLGGQ